MNSKKNVRDILDLYQDFKKGDLDAVFESVAEDVTWTLMGDPSKIPFSGVFKGHAEIKAMFGRVFETMDIGSNEPDHIVASENKVVGYGTLTSTIKENGNAFSSTFVDIFEMEDGMIVRFERLFDTNAMQEAIHGK